MSPTTLLILAATFISRPVSDFELRDTNNAPVRLSAIAPNRPAVVVFMGVDCPMARLYAIRLNELAARFPKDAITVLAIDPNRGDDWASMAEFAREHKLTFPLLKDPNAQIAAQFGATRSPQAFVLDAQRQIRYSGRIDNQYEAGGKNRGAPTREDLVEAVKDVLANRTVAVPFTNCTGCRLSRPQPAAPPPSVTYSRDIAPILAANCQVCHKPGDIGPFPLSSYADAFGHAETIVEVVDNGTMPPWHASPAHGSFRNQRRLSNEQKCLIAEWVKRGCPEGDPLPPVELSKSDDWKMGTPDVVFRIPQEFNVPAEGVVEYQHFVVDPGYASDVWVNGFEVRPGNRRVVHHCSVFLSPPGATTEEFFGTGELGSCLFAGFGPGTGPVQMPPGMAKRIPAGWRLHFVVHYTPIGTPQTDRTELGLKLIDAREVRKEVATKFLAVDLEIPPHASNYRVEQTWTADRNVLLLAMLPHMHVRGQSVRYTVEYPDGTTEILLDVPRYDFNWQHWYQLEEPKRLPAGTVLRCVATYDNSAGNPNNPDPSKTVKTGLQVWDEMFNMYFDVVPADQDFVEERAQIEGKRERSQWMLGGATGLAGLWGFHLWRKRRRELLAVASR